MNYLVMHILLILLYFIFAAPTTAAIANFFQKRSKPAKVEVVESVTTCEAGFDEDKTSCSTEQKDTVEEIVVLESCDQQHALGEVEDCRDDDDVESFEHDGDALNREDDENFVKDLLGAPAEVSNVRPLKPVILPGPKDLSQSPTEGPRQIFMRKYPSHLVGIRERRFCYQWFKLYDWLEYSQVTDSCYCFYCRHFTVSDRLKEAFTHDGFRTWNRCTGSDSRTNAFIRHRLSEDHLLAVERYAAYKSMTASGSTVLGMIDDEHNKLVLENRHYMKTVCEVLRLTATQNIAQRGHRESEASDNCGNFLEMLQLIASHDEIVRKRMEFGPDNAKYTHHSIQNALLDIMASLVMKDIRDEVNQSLFFGIICDESKDLSKKEQISVVLRYIFDNAIHEEFIGFTCAESLNAESLSQYIRDRLVTVGVDIKSCVGQSYDGASVMSGRLSGVQARIREVAPLAIYVHCYAHRLNLVIVDSCKSSRYASEFFSLIQRLYVFVSGSYVHAKWLSLQSKAYPGDRPLELKALSDTRWAAQIAACHAVRSRLTVVLELLEEITEESNGDRAIDARAILNLMDLKFVFCLEVFHDILQEMKSALDCLQSTQLNAAIACDLVRNCQDFLQQKRCIDEFERYFEAGHKIAVRHELSLDILQRRRARLPLRYESEMIVTESIGRREAPAELQTFLRQEIYYPVIDKALSELAARFRGENTAIMLGLGAMVPDSNCFLQPEVIAPFAELYMCNTDDLALEINQLQRLIARKRSEGTMLPFNGNKLMDFYRFVSRYEDAFYETARILRIACTIPVTSVQSERSFSCLKLIKTHLRTTMHDERLSNLAVLSIHSSRVKQLDLDKVVDCFITQFPRCRIQLK